MHDSIHLCDYLIEDVRSVELGYDDDFKIVACREVFSQVFRFFLVSDGANNMIPPGDKSIDNPCGTEPVRTCHEYCRTGWDYWHFVLVNAWACGDRPRASFLYDLGNVLTGNESGAIAIRAEWKGG